MSSLAECLKGFEAGKDVKAELRALARKYAKTMPKADAEKRAAAELLEAVMDDIETVRDELLDDATALLTKAFYSTPARTSVKEAASYAYRLHRVASMARIFNWSQGATEKAFTLKDRLSRFWMRLSGKDEVDLT